MKNQEIEIKLKISEEKYLELDRLLNSKGEFLKSQSQDDSYYQPSHKSFIKQDGSINEWLRLRIEGRTPILTYKYVYNGKNNKGRSKDEYETKVEDEQQTRNLIKALGYSELIRFTKLRKTYKYQEIFEIALDDVSDLGYFMEIEIKKGFTDAEEAESKLEDVTKELGISLEDESILGYAHLLLIKKDLARIPDFLKAEVA